MEEKEEHEKPYPKKKKTEIFKYAMAKNDLVW